MVSLDFVLCVQRHNVNSAAMWGSRLVSYPSVTELDRTGSYPHRPESAGANMSIPPRCNTLHVWGKALKPQPATASSRLLPAQWIASTLSLTFSRCPPASEAGRGGSWSLGVSAFQATHVLHIAQYYAWCKIKLKSLHCMLNSLWIFTRKGTLVEHIKGFWNGR